MNYFLKVIEGGDKDDDKVVYVDFNTGNTTDSDGNSTPPYNADIVVYDDYGNPVPYDDE
ncbi:MAG: hypothetical protein AAGF07_04410 [Patescibacteria group bacterium]